MKRSLPSCIRWVLLTKIAWEYDVQVMIEGPGHVPMQEDPPQYDRREIKALPRSAVLHSRGR